MDDEADPGLQGYRRLSASSSLSPPMNTSEFHANPANPRKITDQQLAALKAAMVEFGDLSGLIVNRNSGNMIGGHQRVKILGDLPVTVTQRFELPTKRGTVAEGYVEYEGERFVYREVRWNERQEKAAMIAANKHGGDFESELLTALLQELKAEDFNMDLTGFSERELNRLLAEPEPVSLEGIDIGDEIRLVQLQLTTETLPMFMEWVRVLGGRFGLEDNVTDTVYRAVEECYRSHNGAAQTVSGEPE
jgi:ParB-like chromosome segregation protein Spo0J